MFKFKKVIGLATLVAIVAALGISSAAMAQSTTTPNPHGPDGPYEASRARWAARPRRP